MKMFTDVDFNTGRLALVANARMQVHFCHSVQFTDLEFLLFYFAQKLSKFVFANYFFFLRLPGNDSYTVGKPV